MFAVARILVIAALAVVFMASAGVVVSAAAPIDGDANVSSVLVINGRLVHGERGETEQPAAKKPAPAQAAPALAAVPTPAAPDPAPAPPTTPTSPSPQPATKIGSAYRPLIDSARAFVAFAIRINGEQTRLIRVSKASRRAGSSRPWYRLGVHKSVTYVSRPSGDLGLDIWYPRGRTTPAPVIVLVHGGGWRGGSRGEWDRIGWTRQLVHRGYIVVAPSYRMACRDDGLAKVASNEASEERVCGYTMAQSIIDVRKSLGWVHRQIAPYGGNPNRVVVVGASAGGHLALMASADIGLFVRGVAAISPASDLEWFGKRPEARLYGATLQAVGCTIHECPGRWEVASPVTFAKRATRWPATYLYDAARDQVTPAPQNAAILRALKTRGVDVTYRHPVRSGSNCHGTYSCSQWMVSRTGRSLLDDVDAWALERVG